MTTAIAAPRFGAHMSIAGGLERSILEAHRLGFDTVQLFTKSNNQWAAKPLTPEACEVFAATLRETGVTGPVAHTSYLINLGSPDDVLWRKSIDALTVEVERAGALGIGELVHHPGAHVGSGEEAGLARIVAGLDEVLRRTPGVPVTIDLEITAGQGSCLGCRLEHLAAIRGRAQEPGRLGVCLDTCHLFAAGYPLASRDDYNRFVDEVDRLLGLSTVRVWHLNDSVKGCDSRVDRHAGLGRGLIGVEPFDWIVKDPRFSGLPMILETPKGMEGDEELDAVNLRILRRSAQSAGPGPEPTTAPRARNARR